MFVTPHSEIQKTSSDPSIRLLPSADNRHVVHESKSQRQHTRVALPAHLEFNTDRGRQRIPLCDLSVDGFSVHTDTLTQSITSGDIMMRIDDITLLFHVNFQVQYVDTNTDRRGCTFSNMSPSQIAGLRHLITSYLNGSLVSIGDFLHQLGQDNFVKRRSFKQEDEPLTRHRRWRAMAISGLTFLMGVAAFGYVLYQMHDILFVTRSQIAKVDSPIYKITMPYAGVFYNLAPKDAIVKKGAPIASFEAPILERTLSAAQAGGVASNRLVLPPDPTPKGTVMSPCDCRIHTQFVADVQYVNKGQHLFDLIPDDVKKIYISARFRSNQVGTLLNGTLVRFRVSGEKGKGIGRVSQIKIEHPDRLSDDNVTLMIQPLTPLAADWIGRPVEVATGGIRNFLTEAPAVHYE